MKTQFRTNVDVAQPFMARLNGEMHDAQPQVGDMVIVLEEKNKVVQMQVCERTWKKTPSSSWAWKDGNTDTILEVYLSLTSFWQKAGLREFERFVKK